MTADKPNLFKMETVVRSSPWTHDQAANGKGIELGGNDSSTLPAPRRFLIPLDFEGCLTRRGMALKVSR